MSAERIVALQCATQIVCQEPCKDAGARAAAALIIANVFREWLAGPPLDGEGPSPAAPAAARNEGEILRDLAA